MKISSDLSLCICTYQRVHLLERLLLDVFKQTLQPKTIIIIDGDPQSGHVFEMLKTLNAPENIQIYFIASNRANLAYQRYLGWRVAQDFEPLYFVYFDDDLHLAKPDALEKLVSPLAWDGKNIVGVTAETSTGDLSKFEESAALLAARRRTGERDPFLVRLFGAASQVEPGGLSPSGHRKAPIRNNIGWATVKWLQGRVMAYAFTAIQRECFSDDFFALTKIRCGLGEDTFLSMRIGAAGSMIYLFDAGFDHPDDALPNAYPIKAYHLGYATAYSRRLLNDNYRPFQSPTFSQRFALWKSYLGTSLLNWWNVLRYRQSYRLAYAWGYTLGALRGLLQKPTAQNLTPDINWWADAEEALSRKVIVR